VTRTKPDVPSPDPSLPTVSGLVVVDKPAGWTSHDVVARLRRLAGTRKVGHAGTLDPMATGVLIAGIDRATRLLTWIVGQDKTYAATIRWGQTTVTDDGEGELLAVADPDAVAAVDDDAVAAGAARLTGPLQQVPAKVSAIKVDGRRAYAQVRAGQEVELAARPVTVSAFDVHRIVRTADDAGRPVLDVDVTVTCSSGTYVRALARDLGADLGVGGHLTALRRTRVGPFGLEPARTLEQLAAAPRLSLSLDEAVAAAFPRRDVAPALATDLAHGRPIPAAGVAGTYGVFAPDGRVLALVREHDELARAAVVLAPANQN